MIMIDKGDKVILNHVWPEADNIINQLAQQVSDSCNGCGSQQELVNELDTQLNRIRQEVLVDLIVD